MRSYYIVPERRYGFWNFALDVFLSIITAGFWVIIIVIREIFKFFRR